MLKVSPDIEREIERLLNAGLFPNVDDLLRAALGALESEAPYLEEWLEEEVLKGMEGEPRILTPEERHLIREAAFAHARAHQTG